MIFLKKAFFQKMLTAKLFPIVSIFLKNKQTNTTIPLLFCCIPQRILATQETQIHTFYITYLGQCDKCRQQIWPLTQYRGQHYVLIL